MLVVDESIAGPVRELGILDPGGLTQLFERQPSGAEGRSVTAVATLPGSGERLLLRRLLHGGLLGPWLGDRFLGLGRPLQELAVTAALRRAGAPVPRPALVAGHRIAGPLYRAVVGTWLEEDAVDLLAFLESDPDPRRVLRACAAAGRAVRCFHDAGGRHGDLHVKNLLIREQGPALSALVIDLDKARFTPGLTPGERMAQVMRLFRSLRKRGVLSRVGARGCARFFGTYCGDDRLLRRAMWRRVDHEMRLVALHAWRYRAARDGA